MDIVDSIFPGQSIHLIAGPTGAGKTRFLFSSLEQWVQGGPVLGFPSHPCPWLYVAADRQKSEVDRTLTTMGLTMTVPFFSAFGVMPPVGAMGILRAAEEAGAELLVWEGFGKYVDMHGGGGTAVSRWLNMVTWRLTHTETGAPRSVPLTIIGVMEEPKMKPRDKYTNPRQRVSGPAAWGHSCDTVIVIEYANEKRPSDPMRRMYVCNHSGPSMEFKATVAGGKFTILP